MNIINILYKKDFSRDSLKTNKCNVKKMKNVNESMKDSLAKLEQSLDIDFEKLNSENIKIFKSYISFSIQTKNKTNKEVKNS